MPDDGLADRFGLGPRAAELVLDEIEGDDAALELERELGGGAVLGRRADVVQEAG